MTGFAHTCCCFGCSTIILQVVSLMVKPAVQLSTSSSWLVGLTFIATLMNNDITICLRFDLFDHLVGGGWCNETSQQTNGINEHVPKNKTENRSSEVVNLSLQNELSRPATPTDQPAHRPTDRPINQPTDQLTDQSTNELNNGQTNQPRSCTKKSNEANHQTKNTTNLRSVQPNNQPTDPPTQRWGTKKKETIYPIYQPFNPTTQLLTKSITTNFHGKKRGNSINLACISFI